MFEFRTGLIGIRVLLTLLMCGVLSERVPLQIYDLNTNQPIELHLFLENVSASLYNFRKELREIKKMVHEKLDRFETEIKMKCVSPSGSSALLKSSYRHCADVYRKLSKESGVYEIQPGGTTIPFKVYCDMTTDGGGWTVFQRRGDYYNAPQDNFYRSWQEYKQGFGDLNTEFWLGNDKLALMTKEDITLHVLRVDLTDVDGSHAYAKYSRFKIGSEQQKYWLLVGQYTGNAGDSLSRGNGMRFSTKDRDNDESYQRDCAQLYRGAWWYSDCHDSNLNGLNLKGPHKSSGKGIEWYTWKGDLYSIYQTEMKFRPVNF